EGTRRRLRGACLRPLPPRSRVAGRFPTAPARAAPGLPEDRGFSGRFLQRRPKLRLRVQPLRRNEAFCPVVWHPRCCMVWQNSFRPSREEVMQQTRRDLHRARQSFLRGALVTTFAFLLPATAPAATLQSISV